ncbi:hypothetical protein [Candidatus Spongiihabitans sp.]|uniref:hypothetical protein n=1 Tax=Candidatus Spongiihabitans sp. TaxID=3101308 RepID=UPI003C79E0AE
MKYTDYKRNYAIPPGREQVLEYFLNQTHEGKRHKQRHKSNSNSEDALTWSCFEVLASLLIAKQLRVLREVFEDAYNGKEKPVFHDGLGEGDLQIHIGKEYIGSSTGESTELDASIELPGKLIFFEAKLYSSMSVATPQKRDQIARKLRVGVDLPLGDDREFFFIFLDIAPPDKMKMMRNAGDPEKTAAAFKDKWKSAYWFEQYKNGDDLTVLRAALDGITAQPLQPIADNMGWLTWSDLFKSILRGVVSK